MKSFRLKGAVTARDFIQDAIAREYQLEIISPTGDRLLVVFYKGTWAVQDPVSSVYIQMDDSPDVLYSQHTMGLCDDYLYENPDNLWVSYCRGRLQFYQLEQEGKILTHIDQDNLWCRIIPAKALTDLIFFILGEVESVDVVQTSRNGIISNGKIIVS